MSRDRSSSIMKKVKDDHEVFFAIGSGFAEPAEIPLTLGFEIQDSTRNRDVPEAFKSYILHFTTPIYMRIVRNRRSWTVKIRVSGESVAKRINGNHAFYVWVNDNNGGDNVKFFAHPTLLKEIENKKNLLQKLIDQDISIFEDNLTTDKIHSIVTDEVFCQWVRSNKNEIFVCYKRRQIKKDSKIMQEHDPFWSFFAFDIEGEASEVEILEDIDSDRNGARICLSRLVGLITTDDRRAEIYEKNISNFSRQVNPTNPISSVVRECLPRETPDGWAWNNLGKECIPAQIRSLEFAQKIGLESEDENERKFWQNVTLPGRMKESYLAKFDKKNNGLFRRKRKIETEIIDI
jgi:hypothetical protein